jgi:DNA (cytosine-5)-methyltransferase 1
MRRVRPITLRNTEHPLLSTLSNPDHALRSALKITGSVRLRKFESLDLFSGAGGLSLGLKAAGFRAAAAVEIDSDSCETYKIAFPQADILNQNIEELDFGRFEGIDLIAGGPPCQPFSSGGKGLARHDPRDMVPQFVRAITQARPRAFLMENVPGLFGGTHRAYLTSIAQQLSGLGYSVHTSVLYAPDFGVPQRRKRGFLIGLRKGTFLYPAPTHGPDGTHPYIPVRAVLDPLRALGEPNSCRVFYAKSPDLRPSPYDGQLFNGGGRPINPDEPSPTILASAGGNKTHFFDTLGLVNRYHEELARGVKPRAGTLPGARRLTVQESAILQTFPADMQFVGSRSSQYTQIGNAVPPLLAKAVGHAVYASLTP